MRFFFDYPCTLLFTYRTGYDFYNSHGGTRLQLKTRLILGTGLLLETRLRNPGSTNSLCGDH